MSVLYVFCCLFFLLLVYVSFMSDKKTSFYFIFLQKRTSSRNSKTAILTKVGFLHKIWNSTQNNFPWKNISFSKPWKTQVLQNLENTSFWVQQTNQLNSKCKPTKLSIDSNTVKPDLTTPSKYWPPAYKSHQYL